ncbi:MAG: DMT family transporter [Clostridiales bacterium]|nr:DMT family transporter [Clostridiales bacterium]MDY4113708.1 DMT family transporter [Roseburia sp.]
MEKRELKKTSIKGTIFVLLSAICFSLGGVLIKSIPWSSVTIQGIRSIFSSLVIGSFMLMRHQRFVVNKTVLLGAVFNTVMAFTFVAATKMTTAANAIVLQFTEPIFVILLLWVLYKKKPGKDALLACVVVFSGILCFFFESLSAGGMVGNMLAIFSGLTYALVMLMKGFKGSDFESSLLISNAISMIIGIPALLKETDYSVEIWGFMILLGVFQFGFSYVFLSKGLDYVSPVTASLTSAIEPILNPLLVAAFCGETIGALGIVGAVLVVGASTTYNVLQAMKTER